MQPKAHKVFIIYILMIENYKKCHHFSRRNLRPRRGDGSAAAANNLKITSHHTTSKSNISTSKDIMGV